MRYAVRPGRMYVGISENDWMFLRRMSAVLPNNFFNAFFHFFAWDHDFVPAGRTAESKVHANPQNQPSFSSAGMFLLQFQNIVEPNIHFVTTGSHFIRTLRKY